MHQLHDFITDYTTSEYFMLLDAPLKEYAETLLSHYCTEAGTPVSIVGLENGLHAMARLDLPVDVRKEIPKLITAFFEFVGNSGRDPRALQWAGDIALLEKNYLAMFRENGTVRGTTFQKKTSETGRNDPCPCGSGKKFKKCCG
jgi:hypothetical protein